ncbi:response regulator transcription factor [Crocinitomicaceae bacterium CZZ-1]|uniref:Response regulator transcription factor n=1 Tax=Taishania pollutisoli TaxID=2766479 RepID=A0A8J6TSM7_9FLAO|nr:response regulator transcription factor [Taishania pollutisoli]MBC9811424.1 response regulator transcription factor [Taishania pollutisoli]MBX2947656.1 response regulator transcription factor [Crocinitomicaceae bacterium]NGF75209.1 response regulator transcription factor [Fluviicola sp. SGL-29]
MKVVIADGNNLMRIGLRTILNTLQPVKVVGEAKSSEELLECLKSFTTDVVLIDYTSDNFEIDVIPKALQKSPNVRFLAITPEQSAQTLVNALRSGVQSYVKKDCDLGEILDAVQETAKGKKFFCGQILETIQRASIDVNDIDFDSFTCEPISLSEREVQIIKMIAEGLTNAQIAEELFLSNHTINTHRKNILSKLGVKNTAGIVMYAVKTHLVSPNKFLFAGE